MRSTLATLAAAVLLLAATAARAQDDSEAYRTLIREAVAEFDGHRFEEARVLFRRAHELSPSARTLRGIGLASYELRDYVTAYQSLSDALASTTRPLTDAQRDEVSALATRAARFIGVYRLALTPADASLRVNGRAPVLDAAGRLLLPLGEHTIEASADGFEPAEQRMTVGGGEEQTLSLRLTARTAAQPSTAQPSTAPQGVLDRPAVAAASAPGSDPLAAIVLLGAGGATAVAALVTGVSWWAFQDEQLGLCLGAPCGNEGDVRSARDAAMGTTVALGIVSASLVVAGVVLLATSSSSDAVAVQCAPGGLGVVCAGRF
jgi:hypothetical protein